MKNPMTPEQQCQAIMDNAAGHDMQWRNIGTIPWREKAVPGGPLNFQEREYRRKPEPIERYVNVHKDGKQTIWKQCRYAKEQADCNESVVRTVHLIEDPTGELPEPIIRIGNLYKNGATTTHPDLKTAKECAKGSNHFVRHYQLVENTAWIEPEPEETNPWRPIAKGEWPECKPKDLIYIRDSIGSSLKKAGDVNWHTTRATDWKYAEDG